MEKTIPKFHLGLIVMLGSVWGLSEAALGMGLQRCASLMSGSLMTGVALFFISLGWAITRRAFGVLLLIIIAGLFKMFDALLLSLPIQHSAIGNPIFAFFLQGASFLAVLMLIGVTQKQKKTGQAIMGGGSALIAAGLFPLVRFATGVPACLHPGTIIPLSIYYGPLAITLSLLTVPLGFWTADKLKSVTTESGWRLQSRVLRQLVSPIALILCLGIVAIIRLI